MESAEERLLELAVRTIEARRKPNTPAGPAAQELLKEKKRFLRGGFRIVSL